MTIKLPKGKGWFDWFTNGLEFIAGIGIIVAALWKLNGITADNGALLFLFNVALIWLVLELGMKWSFKALEILKTKEKVNG